MNHPTTHILRLALALAALAALCSCGFGTASIAASSGGGGGPGNSQPVASDLSVPRSPTSPATISFVLTDQEGDAATVGISFRLGASGPFTPITLAPGSQPLTGVPSSQTPYRVDWDYATDLGSTGYRNDIELQLVVEGGISPAVRTGVAQGNDVPTARLAQPLPIGATVYGNNTDIAVEVADSASDVLRVKVEYNDDPEGNFPELAWKLARPAATPAALPTPTYAILSLQTSATGSIATFRWDTIEDLDGFDADVRIRFTPEDAYGTGAPALTAPFRVDNNAPPIAVLDELAFVTGKKERGNIPITFRLLDEESDEVQLLVQWRNNGQPFPPLPTGRNELVDLLQDPNRAVERAQLQIATEAPLAFTGRTGASAGLGPNQVRLPELATTAAGLLASGIADRTLELMRPNRVPVPTAWTPSQLANPVGALLAPGGRSVAVLDAAGATGWRVRTVDVETGAVVQSLVAGAGAPRALALDPSSSRVFIGSSTFISRFDAQSGASLGAVPHNFVDGPRGLTALGRDVVLATGDNRVVRFDLATGTSSTLVNGLAEPWGIVADPVDTSLVYVAERTANQVSVLDLGARKTQPLTARVAPADVASLGAVPFPSPRAIALEERGARLLVMTESGSLASLRTLDLRSPTDFDSPTNGVADPYVREVTRQLGEAGAALSTGPDGLRIACLTAANQLAFGGGVSQQRNLVSASTAAGQPYSPTDQVVTLTQPLNVQVGTPWRIKAPLRGTTSRLGKENTFVWDTSELPDPIATQVRIVPIDGDVGTPVTGSQFKPFQATFDAEQDLLPLGIDLSTMCAADLDGDGDLDLATVGTVDHVVRLVFQTTPGVFTPAGGTLDTGTGSGPVRVVAADLDGDLDLDLVTANRDGNTLTLFTQTAPGVFGPATSTLPTGNGPWDLAAADLDGDGDLDLATAVGGGNALQLFLQTAPGTFTAAGTLNTGTESNPTAVDAADLDGDGDLDLVSVNSTGDNLTLFFQNGSGTFDPVPTTLPAGDFPFSLVTADLDGDGDVDLATANVFGNDTVRIFVQAAPGVFQPRSPIPGGDGVNTLAAADLDGDRDLDLVTTNFGSDDLRLFFQTEPGTFTPASRNLPAEEFSNPLDVLPADFDGDGDVDLATSLSATSSVRFFRQTSPGSFAAAVVGPSTTGFARAAAQGDLDGDGDIDLAVSSAGAPSFVRTYFQTAPGQFTPSSTTLPAGDDPKSLATGDLDGDGDLDLVMANFNSRDLRILFQTDPGSFTPAASPLSTGTGTFSNPEDVVAADLDQDGDLDLVAPLLTGGLRLFRQEAPGSFTTPGLFLPAAATVAAADLDGDGDTDLASIGSTLKLYFQTAPFVFTLAANEPPAGNGARSLKAADLDSDGDVDLACANAADGSLSIFFQTAPGTFVPAAATLPAGVEPFTLVAADLDGDGDVDLASVDRNQLALTRHLQTAPGIFTLATSTPAPGVGSVLQAADFDGDGDLDLMTLFDTNVRFFFCGR